MLGSDVLATRLGGIYALQGLAQDDPERYHVQILRLFCAFVKRPNENDYELRDQRDKVRDDVQAAMYAISACRQRSITLTYELNEKYRPDFTGSDLRQADLASMNLSNADFPHADLSRAYLAHAKLGGSFLFEARLFGATLTSADIHQTNLSGTWLSQHRTVFGSTPLNGLTQTQLDTACSDPRRSPRITAVDSTTGDPLIWRSGRCNSNDATED